uniref:Uncharacterized protein n=1 Tax=Arundo donax TaxID=35708 RepID=A0A0A9GV93_ARUDO
MGLHSGVDTSTVTMDGVSCKTKTRFPLVILWSCLYSLGGIYFFSYILCKASFRLCLAELQLRDPC